MAKHKVDISGINTSNIPVLSNEEMIELFKKYQNGDLDAKDKLGLIKAIDNFDLSYNLKLSTYACPLIIGEVKRFLRDNNSIRVARSTKDTAYKALKAKEELTNDLGMEPTIKQIADKLELSELEVRDAIDSMKDTISMFEPIYNDGGDTIYLSDQLEDKKDKYDNDIKLALKDAMNKLKPKERYILLERYIVGKTQLELAEEIGISQAQISRLEKSGIENIKKLIL